MKEFDIVRSGHTVGVILRVTEKRIRMGKNARKPGLCLYFGYWYGNNPKDSESFGKIIHKPFGVVISKVTTHQQFKKLLKYRARVANKA